MKPAVVTLSVDRFRFCGGNDQAAAGISDFRLNRNNSVLAPVFPDSDQPEQVQNQPLLRQIT